MPRRKTTTARAAAGTLRPDRTHAAGVPPLTRVPPPPPELGTEEAAAWRWLGREAVRRRTLSRGDLQALAAAARAVATVERLHRELKGVPWAVPSAHGDGMARHPLLAEVRQWHGELRRWLGALGLTPATRGAADPLPEPEELNPLADLLNGGRTK